VGFEAQVVMRLKIQEQSELNFVSRIIPPQAEDIVDIRGIPGAKQKEMWVCGAGSDELGGSPFSPGPLY
jgi:hypothetical protein